MTKANGDTIQAVPLMEGKINIGSGPDILESKGVIHAEADSVIELPFSTPLQYTMLAGADRGYIGKFTIISGSITYE